jgi:ribosomal protein S18 acetylase RimI-like enzyme
MHDMHLSLATREDALALAELLAMTGLSQQEQPDEAAAQTRWDRMQEALPGVQVIVGRRCDGTVMGALTLVTRPPPGNADTPSAVLEDVVVHPVMQREGLGSQLVRCAMEVAREAGCDKLTLSPHPQHPRAQGFFERLGFERQGMSFEVPLSEAKVVP